jgi:hypothetical protein
MLATCLVADIEISVQWENVVFQEVCAHFMSQSSKKDE